MTAASKKYPFYTLSSIRLLRRSAGLRLENRQLPMPTLLYITSGRATIQMGDQRVEAEQNQLLFLPAKTPFHAEIGARGIEYYQLIIRSAMLSFSSVGCEAHPLTSIPGLPESHIFVAQNAAQWRTRLSGLLAAVKDGKHSLASLDRQLSQVIEDLLDTVNLSQIDAEDGITKSILYMKEHYNQQLDRSTLARIAMLTPGAYCRSFKKRTGLTPTEYLQRLRIDQAKQLLAEGMNLKDSGAAVSYASEFHFSRIFKKVEGIPPTLYIKREVLRVAIATRFHWLHNFQSFAFQPVLSVDCYRHIGMDPHEYERTVMLRLGELRAVKPDLIIADFSHESFYDTFRKIAPTINIGHSFDWRGTHLRLAELVGRERDAAQGIEEVDQFVGEASERLRGMIEGQPVAMLQIMPDHIIVQGTVRHPLNELLYQELGLVADPALPQDRVRLQTTVQDMPELQAQHLWVRKYNEDAGVQHNLHQLQQKPFWATLPANRSGSIHLVSNWLLASWTPQGRKEIISEIESYLQ